MKLSKRLLAVASMAAFDAKGNGRLVDVGTDHGYVPIWLITEKMFARGLAADVNEGPLHKARTHIRENNLDGVIDTKRTNGLSGIELSENDVVVMAGMGGLLIADIIKNDIENAKNAKYLVLQPQNHIPELRVKLHELGFVILDEEILKDGGKIYFILRCGTGNERYTDGEYYLSKILILKNSAVFREYLEVTLLSVEKSLDELTKAEKTDSNEHKKTELLKKQGYLRRVLSGNDETVNG